MLITIAAGCTTSSTPSKKQEKERVQITLDGMATKVYDKKTGPSAPPSLSPAYGAEDIYGYNNGPQPVIHQPQVMIVGQTPQRDPNNPGVYRGARVDYVVVKDWQWNETALRKGADISIPDPNLQSGIEELTLVVDNPKPSLPANKQTGPALPPSATTSDLDNNNVLGTPDATTKTAAPNKTDPLELPKTQPAPEAFAAFLKQKGPTYQGLRKSLRTLALPDKAQYDQATRLTGPNEDLGFLPNHGWVAFRTKNWEDLTQDERNRWLADSDYKTYEASYQATANRQLKQEKGRAPEYLDKSRLQPKPPKVVDIDLNKSVVTEGK